MKMKRKKSSFGDSVQPKLVVETEYTHNSGFMRKSANKAASVENKLKNAEAKTAKKGLQKLLVLWKKLDNTAIKDLKLHELDPTLRGNTGELLLSDIENSPLDTQWNSTSWTKLSAKSAERISLDQVEYSSQRGLHAHSHHITRKKLSEKSISDSRLAIPHGDKKHHRAQFQWRQASDVPQSFYEWAVQEMQIKGGNNDLHIARKSDDPDHDPMRYGPLMDGELEYRADFPEISSTESEDLVDVKPDDSDYDPTRFAPPVQRDHVDNLTVETYIPTQSHSTRWFTSILHHTMNHPHALYSAQNTGEPGSNPPTIPETISGTSWPITYAEEPEQEDIKGTDKRIILRSDFERHVNSNTPQQSTLTNNSNSEVQNTLNSEILETKPEISPHHLSLQSDAQDTTLEIARITDQRDAVPNFTPLHESQLWHVPGSQIQIGNGVMDNLQQGSLTEMNAAAISSPIPDVSAPLSAMVPPNLSDPTQVSTHTQQLLEQLAVSDPLQGYDQRENSTTHSRKRKKITILCTVIGVCVIVIAVLGILGRGSYSTGPYLYQPNLAEAAGPFFIPELNVQGTVTDISSGQRYAVNGYIDSRNERILTVTNSMVDFHLITAFGHNFIKANAAWWNLQNKNSPATADQWTVIATGSPHPFDDLTVSNLQQDLSACAQNDPDNHRLQSMSEFLCGNTRYQFPDTLDSFSLIKEDHKMNLVFSITLRAANRSDHIGAYQNLSAQLLTVQHANLITPLPIAQNSYECTADHCAIQSKITVKNPANFSRSFLMDIIGQLHDDGNANLGTCVLRTEPIWNVPQSYRCMVNGLTQKPHNPQIDYTLSAKFDIKQQTERWAKTLLARH